MECHTKKGCTPFHLSCKEGHLEIAKQLYDNGADTEVKNKSWKTENLEVFTSLKSMFFGCYSDQSKCWKRRNVFSGVINSKL